MYRKLALLQLYIVPGYTLQHIIDPAMSKRNNSEYKSESNLGGVKACIARWA